RVFCLYLHRVGGDFHLFGHAANVERDVNVQLVVHFQVDIRRRERLESRGSGGKFVSPCRQRQDSVSPVRSRHGFPSKICLHIGGDNSRARTHSLRTV